MADGDPRMDVFGAVEPVVTHHSREPPVVDDSPSASGIPSSTRSRRTQSVDVSARPARRRRERGERDRIRAELDAAPGLVLDPRIASDVLALEKRFAAASKGKSPASRDRPHHRSHRPRHSLPITPGREHAGSVESHPLSTLPELSSPIRESDDVSQLSDPKSPTRLVGPALPSSGMPAPSPSPPRQDPPPPDSQPAIKIDAPAYSGLLPNSDPEHTSASGPGPKRTSKAAKRSSLTAMLGLTGRKKHKHGSGEEDDSTHLSVRPLNRRVDTQHTMRTFNTVYTTATAGSVESGDRASLGVGSSPGHGTNSSPGQGARSASGTSSNHGLATSPSSMEPPTIEPSAKTIARAAATRDQLTKRYDILYASLDAQAAGSPAPGLNPLQVLRWRAGARRSAEAGRNGMDGGNGEVWDREVERRIRDAPPAFQGNSIPAFLGNSLPEANSLSWLPYLEPLFMEERARADGVGAGRDEYDGSKGMTAWYVLASFVEGYISSREQATSRPESFGSDLPKSIGSDGHKSAGSDAYKSFGSDGKSLPDPPPHPNSKDVRTTAMFNAAAAYARSSGAGTGTGAISDDASASGSRFAIIDRAFRARSKSSVVVDSFNRSRQGSLGVNSEPPSPSHMSTPIPPVPSSQTSQSYNGKPSKLVGPVLSRSGSQIHHSRSQSQARSISAGNGPKQSTNDFGVLNSKPVGQVQPQGDGKMSPASSRLNLTNFIIGGAAVLGLNMLRGGARQPLAKDGVSGSENEAERLSSDCWPSDLDLNSKRHGGLSDGEGGRVKRRKKTWRERHAGEVPLSDGDRERSGEVRRNLRLEKVVFEPVEVGPELVNQEPSEQEREKMCKDDYEKKKVILDEAEEELAKANERLYGFARLLGELNTVHRNGSDVFGLYKCRHGGLQHVQECGLERLSDEPVTPTTPNYLPLISFSKQLGDLETVPTAVDHIGRTTLDADLPIAAFDALHTLEGELTEISKQIMELRDLCDEAEKERENVKGLYESTASSVGTTYPECTKIEQLLGSLVTEDMPWLPSWLPLWVRHLLEIFSGV
ncbi:unnamed protein product [Rhizoctonia solani]|uniref:Uncharacterized protein n=1 Tax=Rhizoctonia solani TaxID=456999 RepID=A0A8H2X9G9_9AGAM|nr:unnamed protein product [Rhizoctonia solani]